MWIVPKPSDSLFYHNFTGKYLLDIIYVFQMVNYYPESMGEWNSISSSLPPWLWVPWQMCNAYLGHPGNEWGVLYRATIILFAHDA